MIESFKLPNITPETLTGSIVSFNDEYGGLPLKSCTSLISGYQEGSGTPSPSNVRPLHAWSGGNLFDTKKNFFDVNFPWVVGSPYRYITYHLPSAELNMSFTDNDTTVDISGIYFGFIDSSYNGGRLGDNMYYKWILINGKIQSDKSNIVLNKPLTGLFIYPNTDSVYEILTSRFNIQIEIGQTASTFEPYNGNTYTFTFGQSIYQGSIDWKRGIVTNNYAIEIFDGSSDEAWGSNGSIGTDRRFSIALNNNYGDRTKSVANYLTYVSGSVGEWGTFQLANNNYLVVKDKDGYFPYRNDYITYLQNNPLTVAYPLATPIEIPLGGINLLTQEGQNNIFCDTGDTTLEWLKVN